LIQSRGEPAVEIRAGDTVHTPPGEWHWHGATPEHFMTHFAVWEASEDGREAEWGDLVADTEYTAAATSASR
jgi:quercetin dioxygenase-like cupin family protein